MRTPQANPDGLVIRVTTSCPGAHALGVAETLATPIEQQVRGVDGATLLESESRNDGTYTLTVHLAATANPDESLVLVQNRIGLALAMLPEACRRQGVTVRKVPDAQPTFWIAVTAEARTQIELTEVAKSTIRDALCRSPGVVEVRVVGGRDRKRVLAIDAEKLNAFAVWPEDVERALNANKVLMPSGLVLEGEGVPHSRLPEPKELEEIVVVTRNDVVIRLRDLGAIHDATTSRGFASARGRSSPLLAVTVWPGKLTAADVRKLLADIRGLPEDVKVELVADTSAGGMAVVDIRMPDASPEAMERVVSKAGELLGKAGVTDWLAFGEEAEPNTATLLLRLPQGNAKAVADALEELRSPEVSCVVSAVSAKQRPFPVRIAVCDTSDQGMAELVQSATALAGRIKATNAATDVTALPGPMQPVLCIRLDPGKLKELGVAAADVSTVMRIVGAAAIAKDCNPSGGDFTIWIDPAPDFRLSDWDKLEVRGAKDQRVPLTRLLAVEERRVQRQVLRVNLHPAVVLSANPPADSSVSDATAKAMKLAATELPKGYTAENLLPPAGAEKRAATSAGGR